ncbi:squalene/phytoene synthase family protein [uncultured Sphingomonas sp.]|uniref:squalene/phytoene synthase family protein n=1 Tax=uncultured Sphingomonas sp. TaxID=158754 RepID=UPI002583B893|nr:squalene/phytoene synthase family protein [uncultured Sphingomonas sp.]
MHHDPERDLALAYAPDDGRRAALSALLALDAALGDVVRSTTQPALGQIRLAWWREQLAKLDDAPPPAMPVLEALAAHVLPRGVGGVALSGIVDGWDVLIEEETLDDGALDRFASQRGGRLFALAARVLGGDAAKATRLGQGWALFDLARHQSDPQIAARADSMAAAALAGPLAGVVRSLGMLALSARLELAGVPQGGPKRAARLMWFGLAGR